MTFKKIASFFVALSLVLCLTAAASAQALVAGGKAIGIRLTADGVIVADTAEFETAHGTASPAKAAGLKAGDIITSLSGKKISSPEDFSKAVGLLDGGETSLGILRAGKEKLLSIKPAEDTEGRLRLGVLLRDGIAGIGTLSFYDPETGVYGALGHSVSDTETGQIIPLGDGSIYRAEIVGLKKGEAGAPGSLEGSSCDIVPLGDIEKNCWCGIFGKAKLDGDTVETGQMKTGKASVFCTLSGEGVKEYEIEIRRVYEDTDSTTALITVTDPALLEITGGIVQGMSGSPIMQDGLLVGAVTHVFVNDPSSGYAVSIQDMLRAAA